MNRIEHRARQRHVGMAALLDQFPLDEQLVGQRKHQRRHRHQDEGDQREVPDEPEVVARCELGVSRHIRAISRVVTRTFCGTPPG